MALIRKKSPQPTWPGYLSRVLRVSALVSIIMITVFLITCDAKAIISKRSTEDLDADVEELSKQLAYDLNSTRLALIPAANPNFEAAFQGDCGKNSNDNPCQHICMDLHDGTYECSCFYGFTLAVDGYSCPPLPADRLSSPSPPAETTTTTTTTTAASQQQLAAGTLQLSTAPSDNRRGGGAREPGPTVERIPTKPEEASLLDKQQHQTAISGNDNFSTQVPLATRREPTLDSGQDSSSNELEMVGRAANDNRKLLVGAGELRAKEHSQNRSQLELSAESEPVALGDMREAFEPEGILPSLQAKWKNRSSPLGGENLISPPLSSDQAGAKSRNKQRSLDPVKELEWQSRQIEAEIQDANRAQADKNKAVASGSSGAREDPYADELRELTGDKSAQDEEEEEEAEYEEDDNLSPTYSADYQDTIDPDIRSIMSNNDKLVKHLASSISEALSGSAPGPASVRKTVGEDDDQQEDDEDYDEDEDHNRAQGHRREEQDSNFDKVYYDLSLLEKLVSATIEDYNPTKAIMTLLKQSFAGQFNQSSAPRRTRHLGKRLSPSSAGCQDSRSCENKDNSNNLEREFDDCEQLAENCDSGGKCIIEQISQPLSPMFPADLSPEPKSRARCQCPLGRGGLLCQKPLLTIVPRFTGHSYLALPMTTDNQLTTLRLLFKPEEAHKQTKRSNYDDFNEETLLLYSNSFVLLIQYSRVELRYSTRQANNELNYDDYDEDTVEIQIPAPDLEMEVSQSSYLSGVTRVIGSRDILFDRWNELIITDATNDISQSNIIQTPTPFPLNTIILVTPEKIDLRDKRNSTMISAGQELFVGGLPRDEMVSGSNLIRQPLGGGSFSRGFAGCIKEFSINQRSYNLGSDFRGDALDGFDIGECSR